ncbi:GNAT family N-acetyltransferase [Granulosicoccaceae sp. 1_MG-2023]|nr:GNAT family N-acetyltransferase [Granulosicoccaceae sp. 1_MG-2023]
MDQTTTSPQAQNAAAWQLRLLHGPDAQFCALIAQLDELMNSLYPPEANQLIAPEALFQSHIRVQGLYFGPRLAGCVAVLMHQDYAEIKRFVVDREFRGCGAGKRLLREALALSRQAGKTLVRLESGRLQPAANRLYRAFGFEPCGPFGAYPDHPDSVFMQLRCG